MKVLLLLAQGFEHMEASVFIDVLGWARHAFKHDIHLDTCGFQREVASTFHVPLIVDRLMEEVSANEYDALAIPGGFEAFGFYREAYDERFLSLIRDFNAQGKMIASVCVAALPLGKSGILEGRRATTYHMENGYRQKQLAKFGACVVNERIVADGNVITSYCPETAVHVAFTLLERLTSKEDAAIVRTAMGY